MKLLFKTASFAAVGALTFGMASLASADHPNPVRLVVVSWGGAYTASQQKAYHEPYMAANPIRAGLVARAEDLRVAEGRGSVGVRGE